MARWRIAAAVAAVVIVVGGIIWLRTRGRVSTDDAQVDGRITQVAARVGGTVIKVSVDNNQPVGAGAVLVQLDPRDYQVAALSTLLVLGKLAFGFDVSWLQVGITLTSALAWQWLATRMGC